MPCVHPRYTDEISVTKHGGTLSIGLTCMDCGAYGSIEVAEVDVEWEPPREVISAVLMPVDGPSTDITAQYKEISRDQQLVHLRELIGCEWVQRIEVPNEGVILEMYVDEEGLLTKKGPNAAATEMMEQTAPYRCDIIVGTAVAVLVRR